MLFYSPSIHCSLKIFLQLRYDEDGRCQYDQKDDVGAGESLGLKNHLQRWKINHQQLTDQRESDGEQKHFIGEKSNLSG